MSKSKIWILTVVMVLSMVVGSGTTLYAAEKNTQQNRYNIVFVTDESGSMEGTDPEKLRYEAIRRFVGLTAQTGNYLGSVSFNDKIASQQKIQAVEGFEQKNEFANRIVMNSGPGWTNIGLGLKTAVETLDKDRNQSLPSAIILLTDGNTEMGDDEQTQQSLALKADAIESARRSEYKIYTICLNTNGSADSAEMQQIAFATGGEFTEVTNSKDLADVETVYYKMIFGSADGGEGGGEIPPTGKIEASFDVPEVGVEEINIIFEGNFTKCQVTDPGGYTYSDAELKEMSMMGKGYSIVKIQNPKGGTWKGEIYGDPGTNITYKFLYNSSFNIQAYIDPTENYEIGDEVEFRAKVCDAQGIVEDISKYDGFYGKVHMAYNGEEHEYDMDLDENGFIYKYEIPDEGTYYAYITVANDEISADSGEQFEFSVNNQSPVAPEEQPTAHANRWPLIGGTATLNLEGTATDPDNEKLVYTIDSTAFNEEDYTLDGTVLKVNGFSIPKGSFTIRATDPHGAYCTYDVLITSTNIGLIMAITICLGGLLLLIILGIIIYKKKFIPFMGTITVEKFDENNDVHIQPISITPGRGSIRLESFVSAAGLPAGCKFQAGGKDKNIYFISKKPVYSNISGGAVKKITIEGSGSEVMISGDSKMEKGITVTFKSILYNQFF